MLQHVAISWGRLQMDHPVSCPWVLCFPSFSWFCSSCFHYFHSSRIRRGLGYGGHQETVKVLLRGFKAWEYKLSVSCMKGRLQIFLFRLEKRLHILSSQDCEAFV
ncbi:uncharacterized protein [Primulina huaijiensis]|uniref:uncharacterized protein isoform X1 n=1 Tax=Primulina huaijiensis TaxID=1492673 RepID=UPI003CC76BE1